MATQHYSSFVAVVSLGLAAAAPLGLAAAAPLGLAAAAPLGLAAAPIGSVASAASVESPGAIRPPGPQTEPGSELRVWLVTAEPGDAVWERYGHNALRVLDTRTGRDVSYNWGIFDFDQTDFIPRFLQGRMLYMMAPFPSQAMIDAYARADRQVVLQELDLTPSEKVELRDFAEINALPENRDYTYEYFLDNCSTRIRDLLDLVLGGRLREELATRDTGTTYRYHTRRLTQVDPLIFTGMDLLMGAPADRDISVWEETFIPMALRDELRGVRIRRADGTERPLVRSEEIVAPSTRAPAPEAPPRWFVLYLLLGLGLGGAFASAATERARSSAILRRAILALGTVWAILGGSAGTIIVLLLFTDHTFAHWNQNLFLVNPAMLALAVLLPLSALRPRWRRRAAAVATALAGIALVGLAWRLVPVGHQQNAMHIALLLPAHLGMAFSLRRGPQRSR